MRDRYGRGYGDRGEMRGQGRGMWQGRGGRGYGYGFGCDQDGSDAVLEALNIRALHPAYLAHLAQQNSVFVCVQQQDGLGVKASRMVAASHRGLGRGFGIAPGYGRAGRAGRGKGYGHGREQADALNDSTKPLQILSVKLPRVELGQALTTTTANAAVNATKSSTPARSKEHHTVADLVAAGLCTGCGDCVALCGRRQAISMQTNDAGDLVPVVDMSLCNLCGKCYRKCPAILETQSSQH